MNADLQSFGNCYATARAILRRASGINKCDTPTSVCCFVRDELHKLTPGHIRNTPANCLVPLPLRLHVPDAQLFKRDELVFIDQLARLKMSKITAAIGGSFISMTKGANDLAPRWTTFCKSFFLALQTGNIPFVPFHPTLPLNRFAITQSGKSSQPQVNAYHLVGGRQRPGFHKARKASVPIPQTITANGQSLTLPFKRPVQLDFYVANLGKTQAVVIQESPVPFLLWIREGIISSASSKARIARLRFARLHAAKKRTKGQFDPLLGLLHSLGVTLLQPFMFLLPRREQLIHIVSAHASSFVLPGLPANFQGFIIYPATGIKTVL